MDLLDQLRALRSVDIIGMSPDGFMTDEMALSPMMPALMASANLESDVRRLISEATDADLLEAYQRTEGERGSPEADALLAEIERRQLDL